MEDLASEILQRERLEIGEEFRPFATKEVGRGGALCLEDLSDLFVKSRGAHLQGRARIRAGDGDLVCGSIRMPEAYESYCRLALGLGEPDRLEVRVRGDDPQLATLCWRDRAVRRELIHRLRTGRLVYLHPFMGSLAVWELAAMLHRSSRRPVQVLAPHPRLCRWVNDKNQFTKTVRRVFGESWVCPTRTVSSLSKLSLVVRDLAEVSRTIGLKIPNAAGGEGNVVVSSDEFRGKLPRDIQPRLKQLVSHVEWEGQSRLLVCAWESRVLSSPSVQLWIPPVGEIVVEGVFEQLITGEEYAFVGSRPARLPPRLTREAVDRSWLLGRLYQLLGYVGRCSFDLLLAGAGWEDARVEFIECNGRWGGTSLPMTLMNRVFGDWERVPYVSYCLEHPGLDKLDFDGVMTRLGEDLFDARTGRGRVIPFNPLKLGMAGTLDVIVLGDSIESASEFAAEVLPRRFGGV